MTTNRLMLAFLFILFLARVGFGQSSDPEPKHEGRSLKGPDAVASRIGTDGRAEDTSFELEFMKPWYDWKRQIHEDYGYSFGLAYVAGFAWSSESLPGQDDYASSAVVRLSGLWELVGRGSEDTGTVSYMVEHRHRYADTELSAHQLENIGSVGVSSVPFQNDGWHLTHLFWDQSWDEGRYEIYAGFLDVTDYVDVYPLTSFWTDFSNYVFSVGAATIDLPDDAALGVAGGAWLSDSIYVMASIEDHNSDPGQPFDGFHSFVNDHEYFTHVEIGWSGAGWDAYYLNNLHLTAWRADERDDQDVEQGWGAFLSFTHPIDDRWLIFARGGFAKDGGSLLERSVSIGGGYTPAGLEMLGVSHQLGFGVNWGRPNTAVFGSGPDDQYAMEAYFRWQVTRELAITPDVQVLINPALDPDEDTTCVLGLRARFSF